MSKQKSSKKNLRRFETPLRNTKFDANGLATSGECIEIFGLGVTDSQQRFGLATSLQFKGSGELRVADSQSGELRVADSQSGELRVADSQKRKGLATSLEFVENRWTRTGIQEMRKKMERATNKTKA